MKEPRQFWRDEIKFRMRYQLIGLIEFVGKAYGEDQEFLKEYIMDVCNNCDHDLKTAIKCFEDLKIQAINTLGIVQESNEFC